MQWNCEYMDEDFVFIMYGEGEVMRLYSCGSEKWGGGAGGKMDDVGLGCLVCG